MTLLQDDALDALIAAVANANGGLPAPATIETRFWVLCPTHPRQGRRYQRLREAVAECDRHNRWCREPDVLILDRMYRGRVYDRQGQMVREGQP